MRFTKQRTKIDCGPVVVANASKWAGKPFNYTLHKDFLHIELDCYMGTYKESLKRVLRKLGKSAKFKIKRSVSKYNQLDFSKNSVVFLDTFNNHVSLIIGATKSTYICVNFTTKTLKSYIPKTRIEKIPLSESFVLEKYSK